jgi:hypothetical protein
MLIKTGCQLMEVCAFDKLKKSIKADKKIKLLVFMDFPLKLGYSKYKTCKFLKKKFHSFIRLFHEKCLNILVELSGLFGALFSGKNIPQKITNITE